MIIHEVRFPSVVIIPLMIENQKLQFMFESSQCESWNDNFLEECKRRPNAQLFFNGDMTILLGTICALVLIPIIWMLIPDRIEPTQINKKLAHIFFLFIDLLFLWLLWVGYNEIKEIIAGIHSQADIIRVGSRVGFYVVGIFMPITHIFIIVNSLFPIIEKKYSRLVNQCFIVALVTFLATGYLGSSWIKTRVENAGYTYCRNASGISALARTLVYTKNIKICEELVEENRKQ